MAPKKADGPPPLPVDTSPYGVFVNVVVASANVDLDLSGYVPAPPPGTKGKPPPPQDGPVEPPKTHLVMTYSADWAPVAGEPTEDAGSGCYNYCMQTKFRRDEGMPGLLDLINHPAILTLHESGSNAALAHAKVDMLPFAMGESELEHGTIQLVPLEVPAGAPKVNSGVLNGVRLWLTHRPKPEAAPGDSAVSSSRPVSTSSRPASSTAKADPAALEAQLPEPAPYRYLTPQEVEGTNVVELQVTGFEPLPPNLAAAVAAATEGKAGGKVSFSAGMPLPGGTSVVVAGGVLVEGKLVFAQPSRRQFLTKEQNKALKFHLEDGLPLGLEVAKYLTSDTMADPAWDHHHGQVAVACCQALMEPGATACSETVVLGTWTATPQQASVLPEYVAPSGKSIKSMEAPPEAPADGSPLLSAWELAGTQVSVSVQVVKPVVRPWQPPPQAPCALTQLIPARDIKPLVQSTEATDAFKAQVKQMAAALVDLVPDGPGSCDEALMCDLLSSGKYLELRDSLKRSAVKVAMEKLRNHGQPLSDAEKVSLLTSLHAHLNQQLHGALSDLQPDQQAARCRQLQGESRLQQLGRLAGECEAQGLGARAEALHQRRLLEDRDSAEVWYDYGCYCLRSQQQGRGEECFRQALEQQPSHLPSLHALSLLLLHQGQATDPQFLEGAESAAVRARAAQPQGDLPWALLFLIYSAWGDEKVNEETHAAAELCRLEQQAVETNLPLAQANPLLALAQLALDLRLAHVALSALQHAEAQLLTACQLPGATAELAIAGARARSQLLQAATSAASAAVAASAAAGPEQAAAANSAAQAAQLEAEQMETEFEMQLSAAAAVCPPNDPRPDLLAGELHFKAGRFHDAVHSYYAAVGKAGGSRGQVPVGLPLSAFLLLATAYLELKHPSYALEVYTQACAAAPCGATWLGVAQSRVQMHEYDAADQALAEALAYDPESPGAWGYCAMVALRCKRAEEASHALNSALKFGLNDQELLLSLAREFGALDRSEEAAACYGALARSAPQSSAAHAAYAEALMACGDVQRARAALERASQSAASEQEVAAVNELVPQLLDMQMKGMAGAE